MWSSGHVEGRLQVRSFDTLLSVRGLNEGSDVSLTRGGREGHVVGLLHVRLAGLSE